MKILFYLESLDTLPMDIIYLIAKYYGDMYKNKYITGSSIDHFYILNRYHVYVYNGSEVVKMDFALKNIKEIHYYGNRLIVSTPDGYFVEDKKLLVSGILSPIKHSPFPLIFYTNNEIYCGFADVTKLDIDIKNIRKVDSYGHKLIIWAAGGVFIREVDEIARLDIDDVVDVVVGINHGLILTSHGLYGFGYNAAAQIYPCLYTKQLRPFKLYITFDYKDIMKIECGDFNTLLLVKSQNGVDVYALGLCNIHGTDERYKTFTKLDYVDVVDIFCERESTTILTKSKLFVDHVLIPHNLSF